MQVTLIKTVDDLKYFLKLAIQLEHATIPPYLTALYSLKPGTNSDAAHVIRTVAVEEMLHLTLAANMTNAIGGQPDLTADDFVPEYPAYLPDGEKDFQVNIEKFSHEAISTFLKIERPADNSGDAAPAAANHPAGTVDVRERPRAGCTPLLRVPHEMVAASVPDSVSTTDDSRHFHFFSIGEFYKEIERGFIALNDSMGPDALFCGKPNLQVTPEYYYSGGGCVHPVHDLDSARKAIKIISDQGEGYAQGVYGDEGELAHYYRFKLIFYTTFSEVIHFQ
jgi:hypothetical protein